jgi:uncharacterized Ntn-hydrolase superfamily protein
MTFSIAARCRTSGMLGIAVASSSPAVAARCAHARAGVGAVGSQNITDPRLGTLALDLLETGKSAATVLDALKVHAGDLIAYRQISIVDSTGEAAAYSGERTLGCHASATAPDVACAGNLLAHDGVPAAMRASFAGSSGTPLGTRLIAAMQAGLAAGGEAGPIHSCGLKLVRDVPWPVADLRVDWHDDPIGELARLWSLWAPQMDDYVTRALDPSKAPSYGVPGDR